MQPKPIEEIALKIKRFRFCFLHVLYLLLLLLYARETYSGDDDFAMNFLSKIKINADLINDKFSVFGSILAQISLPNAPDLSCICTV